MNQTNFTQTAASDVPIASEPTAASDTLFHHDTFRDTLTRNPDSTTFHLISYIL